MTTPHLRVFGIEASYVEEQPESQWTETRNSHEVTIVSDADSYAVHRPKMVTVRVKDVIDALAGNAGRRPIWINDFCDDPISITEDMFEVLVAYRAMKRAA
ncbi:MAG: hypothetical protein MUF23_09770 [Pirellula sp.]|jgi:hypothetical protein|nr:hypothetical protein [Pirellula sp.]